MYEVFPITVTYNGRYLLREIILTSQLTIFTFLHSFTCENYSLYIITKWYMMDHHTSL